MANCWLQTAHGVGVTATMNELKAN